MNTSIRWRTIGAALAAVGIVAAALLTTQYLRDTATPGVLTAATVQGGCNPYQVQATSIGTFDMTVCLSDNGTGTTAYPRVDVNRVPPYLGTSCTIGVELWDGHGHNFGTFGQSGCQPGSHPGKPYGPVPQPATLHAFANLTVCLLTACTSYHLGGGAGDSPSIEVQPFVEPTVAPSTQASSKVTTGTQTNPVPSLLPVPPRVDQSNQPSPCSQDDMTVRLGKLPPWTKGQPTLGSGYDDKGREYETESGPYKAVTMAGQPYDTRGARLFVDTARAMIVAAGDPDTGLSEHAEPKVAAYMSLYHTDATLVCLVINNTDGPCHPTVTSGPNAGMQVGCLNELPDMLCTGQTLDVFWRPPGATTLSEQPFPGRVSKPVTVPNRQAVACG